MAIIGILKEPEGENRVVALPEIAAQLVKMNFQVLVESGAGSKAFASDEDYKAQGLSLIHIFKTNEVEDLTRCW